MRDRTPQDPNSPWTARRHDTRRPKPAMRPNPDRLAKLLVGGEIEEDPMTPQKSPSGDGNNGIGGPPPPAPGPANPPPPTGNPNPPADPPKK
ncbi:hypothetical protein ACFWXO_39425 [Kitasatospora sp. NPDC059088]|uniref:hypothetical protein n=1 Tax=Kitasatospora sp. NPDC059088 TaxID=3346722 RepID=UPI003691C285